MKTIKDILASFRELNSVLPTFDELGEALEALPYSGDGDRDRLEAEYGEAPFEDTLLSSSTGGSFAIGVRTYPDGLSYIVDTEGSAGGAFRNGRGRYFDSYT